MKQHISTLMDGELFDDEAQALLDKLKRNPDAQQDWQMYHLIGDALRQPDHVHADIGAAMRERLQAEPTVFAPRAATGQNVRWFALSAAASVMALTLVAWLSVQVGPVSAPQMAAMQQSATARVASLPITSLPINGGLNDYLMAHQEFSPSTNVHGAVTYMRTVAGQ